MSQERTVAEMALSAMEPRGQLTPANGGVFEEALPRICDAISRVDGIQTIVRIVYNVDGDSVLRIAVGTRGIPQREVDAILYVVVTAALGEFPARFATVIDIATGAVVQWWRP